MTVAWLQNLGHNKQVAITLARRKRWLGLLVLIVATAFAVRLIDLPGAWLWYDELQSVTHARLSVANLVESVRAFDPHPPLYYLQLHFWMLLGTSTQWIKLNSVAWSLLALLMLFVVGRAVFDREVALSASAIFALAPYAVFYAQEARMYAMLMFLGLGSFYFTWRYFLERRWLYLIGVLAFALTFLFSHGAGFMVLASLGTYAVWRLIETRLRNWRTVLIYLAVLLFAVLLNVGQLEMASGTVVGHTLKPGLNEVVDTLAIVLFGFHDYWAGGAVVVGLAVIAVAAASVWDRRARAVTCAFILAPIIVCIAISYLNRPIWLHRTLAYTVPFWSLVIAFALLQAGKKIARRDERSLARYSLLIATLLLLTAGTVFQQMHFAYDWRFDDAAQFIGTATRDHEMVYVPSERVLWGLGWYLSGPGSVTPLAKDKVVLAPSGAQLVSAEAPSRSGQSQPYWVVFRTIDDVTGFRLQPSDPTWDFSGLEVVRVDH